MKTDPERQQAVGSVAAGSEPGPRPAKTPASDRRRIVSWSQSDKEMSPAMLVDVRARIKTMFAIVAPIGATAGVIGMIGLLAGAHSGYSTVRLALILAACVVVLLVWAVKFAIPLVTKGRLPNGRLLTDVIARQRMRRRRERARQARRRRAGL